MKRKLFGENITPSCEYCLNGLPASGKDIIICKKKKQTEDVCACKKFKYDPLRRKPKQEPTLPEFHESDFKI